MYIMHEYHYYNDDLISNVRVIFPEIYLLIHLPVDKYNYVAIVKLHKTQLQCKCNKQ